MEDYKIDQLTHSIDKLTEAMTELAVKVKRLTNSPITREKYNEVVKQSRERYD